MTAPLSLNDVKFASRMSQMSIHTTLELAENLTTDPDRDERLARQQCAPCFYVRIIAGQAFTTYECELCQTKHKHPNTATPKLCTPCASHNALCVRCCADMNGPEAAAARTDPPTAPIES